jgi:sulfide:quinone oxidoreductase
MTTQVAHAPKFRVLIVGGGVAALETALALHDLAAETVAITALAPNSEFVYRPTTVREPFAYGAAARYPLAPILADVGAELIADSLGWVDHREHVVHTASDTPIEYDALVLALGAHVCPRYKHAVTIDDRHMDEALHGLIQDIEGGYLDSIAFVSPGRMAWPLPLYELALMTASRAYDVGIDLRTTIITPEDEPLAIFGQQVSDGVAGLLARANITTINSAYAEIPAPGEIVINPGDRRLHAKRIVALPELYGPAVRGLPVSKSGFLRVNRFGRVPDVGPVFAAGDATDFPVKQGGLAAQQADTVAESVAALTGVQIEPQHFMPVIHGVLLTGDKPRYLSAKLTGGHGSSSHFSETPGENAPEAKINAKYLAPYLQKLDHEQVAA